MSSLIEEVFNRINTHKGIEVNYDFIQGIILCDMDGTPIKTTLNNEQTYFYTTSAAIFIKRCKNIVTELVKVSQTNYILGRINIYQDKDEAKRNNDCS